MHSPYPLRLHQRRGKRRARTELLAPLFVWAVACTLGDDPRVQPTITETTESEPEASEDAATATGSGEDVSAPPPRAPGGGKPASAVSDAGGSASAPIRAVVPPTASNGSADPLGGQAGLGALAGSGNLPQSPVAPLLPGLDAGALAPNLSTLTPDAAVSLACASEFAGCVLANVFEAGPCLDKYGTCEPGFRGGDGGADGTCAVHFSACVLENPVAFERCFPKLTECQVAP